MRRTLFEKIWDRHVVRDVPGEPALVYVDLHLVHEVTSPQAFEGLRLAGRRVRRPDLTVATMDHNVPTLPGPITDPLAKAQLDALRANCAEFGIQLYGTGSGREGIVHVIGPELGLTQPGKTIVCGDSHTSTHGAFGALAFGIGTSEVEHVLATQTLGQRRPEDDAARVRRDASARADPEGHDPRRHRPGRRRRRRRVRRRVRRRGRRGALDGAAPDDLQHVDRVGCPGRARWRPTRRPSPTSRAGRFAPSGEAWERAVEDWRTLRSDPDATYDSHVVVDVSRLEPQVTWGTNPGMVVPVSGAVPDPASFADPDDRAAGTRALEYMGLRPGQPIEEIRIDRVFIGSCTNARIEDLRAAAEVVRGRTVDPRVKAMVVPGSAQVRLQAQDEGLDQIFLDAGFEWRLAGCSMCLGMNPDILAPGERCASTSNRNFEGRQGRGGRTHLVSPQMAAAAALHGHFVDVRSLAEEAVPA